MSGPPILCPGCQRVYDAKPSTITNPGDTVSFAVGVRFECPYCGEIAEQRSSASFSIGSAGEWRSLASALTPAHVTQADYQRLAVALTDVPTTEATPDEVADRIRVAAPAFTALADFIQSTRGTATIQVLQVVLSVIAIVLSRLPTTPPEQHETPPVQVTVNVEVDGAPIEEKELKSWIEDAVRRAQNGEPGAPGKDATPPSVTDSPTDCTP